MKWALLGHDPEALDLARAIVGSNDDQLVAGAELGPARALVASLAPAAVLDDGWEAWLENDQIQGVVVGRGAAGQRDEALERLTRAGRTLIVCQPSGPSMQYFELEMLRQESGARLLPYLPARWHPAVTELFERLAAGPSDGLGPLEQVIIERQLPDRSPEAVLAQLMRDLDLARSVAGELTQVGALAPAVGESRYAGLGVQLSGPAGVLVRWSTRSGATLEGKLTLLGRAGTAALSLEADPALWTVAAEVGSRTFGPLRFGDWLPAREALARAGATGPQAPAWSPAWLDAARAVELTEAVPRSLDRNKTVELRADEASELQAFKGTMAASGCGLLLFALLVFFLGTVASGFGVPLAGYWPAAVLVLLCVFLLLQLLRWIVPAEEP